MEKFLTEDLWIRVLIYLIILFYVFTNKYIVYNVMHGMSRTKLYFKIFMISATPFIVLMFIPIYSGDFTISFEVLIISQLIFNHLYYVVKNQEVAKKANRDEFIRLIYNNKYEILKLIELKLIQDDDIKSVNNLNEKEYGSRNLVKVYRNLKDSDIRDYLID